MIGYAAGHSCEMRLGLPARLRLALRAGDPGGLRLMQGVKTVLAVLLTLAVLYPFQTHDELLAASAAGYLMQCGEGDDRRRQQLTLVLSGVALIVLAVLGAVVTTHRLPREILLVVVAFFAFYVRKFVPRRPGFTTFAFIIYLLATLLPGGRDGAEMNAAVLAVALVVAFLVFFGVRPADPAAAFADGVRVYRDCVAVLLRAWTSAECANPPVESDRLVRRAVAFNQALMAGFPPGRIRTRMEALLAEQYDALQSLEMLQDSLARLVAAPERREVILPVLHALAAVFTAPPQDVLTANAKAVQTWKAMKEGFLPNSTPLDPSLIHVGGVLRTARVLGDTGERITRKQAELLGKERP